MLRKRSYQPELLDGDQIPFADILQNMQELNFINTWLGGHSITLSGFKQFSLPGKPITICEIGCGGGDNLRAIAAYCNKKGIEYKLIGIDLNPFCIETARQQTDTSIQAQWFVSDYKEVLFVEKPDILFSSLFCHHFKEDELILQLQWMQQNSKLGFFINDLQRNNIAYYAIKLLTGLFSKSYLVKHDAPLSVARAFIRKEWKELLSAAGIYNYTLQWKWAFRFLITVINGKPITV